MHRLQRSVASLCHTSSADSKKKKEGEKKHRRKKKHSGLSETRTEVLYCCHLFTGVAVCFESVNVVNLALSQPNPHLHRLGGKLKVAAQLRECPMYFEEHKQRVDSERWRLIFNLLKNICIHIGNDVLV